MKYTIKKLIYSYIIYFGEKRTTKFEILCFVKKIYGKNVISFYHLYCKFADFNFKLSKNI